MKDKDIIALFFARDESAIKESADKYGDYCFAVASRILNDNCDAEECVNDTWFSAWNRIPPERPSKLGAFFSRITRNIAAKRLRGKTADKRGGGTADLIFEELEDCLTDSKSAEDSYLSKEFTEALNKFYKTLQRRDREIFLCRYYSAHEISAIADAFGMSDNYVRTVLSRTRQKLKEYMDKEGLL